MRRQYVAAEYVTPLEWAVLLSLLVLGAALAAGAAWLIVEVLRRWLG